MDTMSIDSLESLIKAKDKEGVKAFLVSLLEELKTNNDLALEITTPVVITKLHASLIEDLGVNPRLMKVNGKAIPNRTRRAMLFTQAMLNGVNYLK